MRKLLISFFLCSSYVLFGQNNLHGSWKGLAINKKLVSENFLGEWLFKEDGQLAITFDGRSEPFDVFDYTATDETITLKNIQKDVIFDILHFSKDSLALKAKDDDLLVILNKDKSRNEVYANRPFSLLERTRYDMDISDIRYQESSFELITIKGYELVHFYNKDTLVDVGKLFRIDLEYSSCYYVNFEKTKQYFKLYFDEKGKLNGRLNEEIPFTLEKKETQPVLAIEDLTRKPLIFFENGFQEYGVSEYFAYEKGSKVIHVGKDRLLFYSDNRVNLRKKSPMGIERQETSYQWMFNHNHSKVILFKDWDKNSERGERLTYKMFSVKWINDKKLILRSEHSSTFYGKNE